MHRTIRAVPFSVSIVVVLVTIAACGSSSSDVASTSGLPESDVVSHLTTAELTTLCDWSTAYEGGPGTTLPCGITVNTVSQCMAGTFADPSCTATVSDVEACAGAIRSDSCTALASTACAPLLACATPG
jgi:hypothetical protein